MESVKAIHSVFLAFIISSTFLNPFESKAAPYYEGKIVQLVVGNNPGGGYDRLARLVAKYLPNYIPGRPRTIIQNMAGAASIISANYIYSVAKPDGLTIGVPGRGLPLAQLLKVEGVKYDIRKFSWIGSMAVESTILSVRSDLPYQKFSDLKGLKEPIPIGGTGLGESSTHFAILLKEFLGVNLKMIFYPSGSDVMLALERKEVDGRVSSYSGIRPHIERGLVRPLIRSRAAEKGIEHLPVDEDLVQDKKGKAFMSMRAVLDLIGRPYFAPPGVPAELMKVLKDAFSRVARDPGFIAEAKKNMLEIEFKRGEECLQLIDELFRQPPELVQEFSKYVKF